MSHRQYATPEHLAVAARVAARYGLTLAEVRGPTRSAWYVLARREVCRALTGLGVGLNATGRVVARAPAAVRSLVRADTGWCKPLPPVDSRPLWRRGLEARKPLPPDEGTRWPAARPEYSEQHAAQ